MNKEQRSIVMEYVQSLPDDQVRELATRLTESYQDDFAICLDLMSQSPRMDAMLYATNSADELYRLTDRIKDILTSEGRKRKVDLRSVIS